MSPADYLLTCPHLLNVGRVAQGTGAIHVVNREHRVFNGWVLVVEEGLGWWTVFVTHETLLGLDVQIAVMDVVDVRWYLCLHQGFDGFFLDGIALLTSIQTAKERPPPEPPPAWWTLPEPPPSAYDTALLVTGRRSVILLTFLVALSILSERPSVLVGIFWLFMCLRL